jgi:hypothetical protein
MVAENWFGVSAGTGVGDGEDVRVVVVSTGVVEGVGEGVGLGVGATDGIGVAVGIIVELGDGLVTVFE